MPPIYPTVPGQYVFPTPSSQVDAGVYVNMDLTQVVADGVTLTANTVGTHYFSIGASVTLAGTAYSIFDVDGTYTISTIPTANSFTCSTTLAGISYNGTASVLGAVPSDVVSYFSTSNFDLWAYNLTNKTWGISSVGISGDQLIVTTSSPSGFAVGQYVNLTINSLLIDGSYIVVASTDTTFTIVAILGSSFVAVGEFGVAMYSQGGESWTPAFSSQSGDWTSVAFGNGTFVAVCNSAFIEPMYSTDNGQTWLLSDSLPFISFNCVAFGNNRFVAIGYIGETVYSIDNGKNWIYGVTQSNSFWLSLAFGINTFVAVSDAGSAIYSSDGDIWYTGSSQPGSWYDVTFSGGRFVATGYNNIIMYSDDGQNWVSVSTGLNSCLAIAFGNNTFVAVNGYFAMYSTTNAISWLASSVSPAGQWSSVTFANNIFVAVSLDGLTMYSSDGDIWALGSSQPGTWYDIVSSSGPFVSSQNDLVYLTVPPLEVNSGFSFSSNVYQSISFANAIDASFWGFDARNGLTYSFPVTVPWTLTQSGWINGFLPPSTSTYDDSVAHKLCKAARVLIGKQTIKEFSGEYIELQNDLTVPYENKAILKLMNGTLDQTQATVAREYYVNLPLGTKEIPLCALTHQHMSVEIDFESFLNLSQNLNPGTGDFLDAKSYLTYDASTGLLSGQPIDVQTTFSYQQYIFIVTYDGQFIVYDTTKDVTDPASYIVISGSSLFSQFCVLSGNLYIGLSDGRLARYIIDELIQGDVSSYDINNYTPTIGSLTGTIVADFRYVYYAVSNTATSNVFFNRYDTTGVFTNPVSYTSFNFTENIDSDATLLYQFISTGSQLLALTNTSGKFYIYNLNANFTTAWTSVDYSQFAGQITSGVLIGKTIYFIGDLYNVIVYTDGLFTGSTQLIISVVIAINNGLYYGSDSSISYNNGITWTPGGELSPPGDWISSAFGNGIFVAISINDLSAYSTTDGESWVPGGPLPTAGDWRRVAFGNSTFVAISYNSGLSAHSTDGQTWTLGGALTPASNWNSLTFGNGTFVAISTGGLSAHSTDGQTWTLGGALPPVSAWYDVTFGGGRFVAIGYFSSAYSDDYGQNWESGGTLLDPGGWTRIASDSDNIFVAVRYDNATTYSTDKGQTWVTGGTLPSSAYWDNVTYVNGVFVAVAFGSPFVSVSGAYSTNNGQTWVASSILNNSWTSLAVGTYLNILPEISTSGIINLHAVGNYIYASAKSSTLSSVLRIDTLKDLSTSAAYQYYSTNTGNAPIPFDGSAPKIFANGPRFVYMFTQGDNTATNIIQFDPYPPTPIIKTSILVDYESLPPGVPKPDKALIGLVQTQKVTDMNYMNIKGPVKELWVTGTPDTANVFQYSNLAARSTLELTGEQIVTEDVGTRTFLKTIQAFETHTSMPIRNVSVIPFELDPESEIPNGTINFSRIRDQVFDGDAETVWASTYNLLAIQGGIGGLIFNS
jgi:hypothetical protein